eukprot:scaffold32370_cov33-Attheya_sp.AAC.1
MVDDHHRERRQVVRIIVWELVDLLGIVVVVVVLRERRWRCPRRCNRCGRLVYDWCTIGGTWGAVSTETGVVEIGSKVALVASRTCGGRKGPSAHHFPLGYIARGCGQTNDGLATKLGAGRPNPRRPLFLPLDQIRKSRFTSLLPNPTQFPRHLLHHCPRTTAPTPTTRKTSPRNQQRQRHHQQSLGK